MKQYLIQVIGSYTSTGDGFGGADWPFIFCGILLILTFWFLYRILITIFK